MGARGRTDGPLEEGVALFDVLVDRRDDAPLRLVRLATEDDLAGGLGHEISEAPKVAFGDYARVRVRGESALEAERRGRLLERLYKGVLSRARDEDVVGSRADLRKRGGFSATTSCEGCFVVLRPLKTGSFFFLPGRRSETCPRGRASRRS
jgi:hypothetical protein